MQKPPFYPPSLKRGFFQSKVPVWFFLVMLAPVAIIASFAGYSLLNGTANTSPSTGATSKSAGGNTKATPTQVTITSSTQWKTVRSFSHTGNLTTDQFTVTSPWRFVSSCVPNSWHGTSFSFSVDIDYPDDHDGLEPAAITNYICGPGNQNEVFFENDGGSYYLQVSGLGAWNVEVQEIS